MEMPRILELIRPDEIAECWDVSDDLYRALWDRTPKEKSYDPEDNGPADVIGMDTMTEEGWQSLPDDLKTELIGLIDEKRIY
jgi:hypothetical protein